MFGKRKSRGRVGGGLRAFQPAPLRLEDRQLLALDVTYTAVGNPTAPSVQPFGVEEVGAATGAHDGEKVTDVGDVNKDGYDDFVIAGTNGNVYLLLGSRQVNVSTAKNFLTLSPTTTSATSVLTPTAPFQRNGSLNQLGSLNQSSPGLTSLGVSPTTGFDFAGAVFTDGQQGSNLGVSVAALGDLNGDGYADFAIGAPGTTTGTGPAPAVFIVYGSAAFNSTGAVLNFDLSNAASYSTISVKTLLDSNVSSRFGTSIASVGNALGASSNAIGSGSTNIAIGAPRDAPVSSRALSGAVYVVPVTRNATLGLATAPAVGTSSVYYVNGSPSTVTPTQIGIGQTGGPGGSLLIGAAGQQVGFSVAGAGNFYGDAATNVSITDFLIGTQTANVAYLVRGAASLANTAETSFTNSATSTILAADLATLTTATSASILQGAAITSTNTADELGFALSSAGDVNNDTRSDFMIGSPGYTDTTTNLATGRATIVYSNSASPLLGSVNIDTTTTTSLTELEGASANALAGFSLGTVGRLNISANTSLNLPGDYGLLIGAPGSGDVYVVEYAPGTNNYPGSNTTLSLATITTPTAGTAGGAGVGGLDINAALATTLGATSLGYSVGGSPTYIVSGGNVDQDPYSDIIIGAPTFSGFTSSSFTSGGANAGTPIATPGSVNEGIAFLLEGGPLRAAGYFPAVVGIGGGGGSPPPGPPPPPPPPVGPGGASGLASAASTGFVGFDTAAGLIPPNGEALVPTVAALSVNKYYKPIPVSAALKAFRPDPSFSTRNGIKGNTQHIESRYVHKSSGINTLPRYVFDSSKFPKGTYTKAIKHKGGPYV